MISVDPAKVERIVENLRDERGPPHEARPSTIWVRVCRRSDGVPHRRRGRRARGSRASCGTRSSNRSARDPTPSSAHSPGTGIGLSLVGEFAELHGGRAWVEERDGGGASFRVFLPAAGPGPQDGPRRADEEGASPVGQRGGRLDSNADARRDHNPASDVSTSRSSRRTASDGRSRVGRPQAPVAEGAARRGSELTPSSRRSCATSTSHTVCEEAMCPNIAECWEAARGDVPDPGRPVHPPVRLLRRDDGEARRRSTRTSPGAIAEAVRRWACASSCSPASRATTCPTAAPASGRPRSAPSATPSPGAGSRCCPPTSRAASATSRP